MNRADRSQPDVFRLADREGSDQDRESDECNDGVHGGTR